MSYIYPYTHRTKMEKCMQSKHLGCLCNFLPRLGIHCNIFEEKYQMVFKVFIVTKKKT